MFTRCTCQQKLIETKHLLVATDFQVSIMPASYLMILFFSIHISNLRALRDSVALNSIRISVVSFILPKLRSIRPLSNLAIAQFSRSMNHQPLYMIKEKVEKEVW